MGGEESVSLRDLGCSYGFNRKEGTIRVGVIAAIGLVLVGAMLLMSGAIEVGCGSQSPAQECV